MTYEELKAQDDWYRSFPDWGDDDVIILDNIRARLKANASRHFFKMLTDIDKSMQTTSKDLVESLLKAGFPKEKLVVENDEKAQIELDGIPYTISSTQTGHSYLYENNNSRNFIDFIHTPADIMAAFIVERYCSANWLEEESQRTLAKYKAYWVWERKRKQLAIKCSDLDHSVRSAIYFAEDYTQYRDDYISAKAEYFKHIWPFSSEKEIKAAAEEKWNEIDKMFEEEKKRALKAKKARERYEKVGKQKREAKKQEILEQKKALLLEYKEKYGVECKFIYVHSPYDPHHRFVVPASEGQVVSFFAPDGFDRDFYDRAMRLVELLNELTATYGKGKVQKKGSLPKEGNQKLQKLLDKIGISRQWQGIYSESQRHYLDNRYKNEVPID
jgi:hypothetical protein